MKSCLHPWCGTLERLWWSYHLSFCTRHLDWFKGHNSPEIMVVTMFLPWNIERFPCKISRKAIQWVGHWQKIWGWPLQWWIKEWPNPIHRSGIHCQRWSEGIDSCLGAVARAPPNKRSPNGLYYQPRWFKFLFTNQHERVSELLVLLPLLIWSHWFDHGCRFIGVAQFITCGLGPLPSQMRST